MSQCRHLDMSYIYCGQGASYNRGFQNSLRSSERSESQEKKNPAKNDFLRVLLWSPSAGNFSTSTQDLQIRKGLKLVARFICLQTGLRIHENAPVWPLTIHVEPQVCQVDRGRFGCPGFGRASPSTHHLSNWNPPLMAIRRIPQLLWDTDGVNGGPSSITILLRWLSTNNNYERWCLHPIKRAMCDEILMEMNHHGISHRSAQS